MDSQRWQQERQPGETGRGGSHSPYVRDAKVSRGPDASLVAYQDSRTHAARQHWGPTKPYDVPTEPYEQPRTSTSARTAYATSGYASSDAHYTTTPTSSYASTPHSHSSYGVAPAAAAPRTQPADQYSAYQQPAARDYTAHSSYPTYPVQSTADSYGRQAVPTTAQYATQRYLGHIYQHRLSCR
jgi:hypothetical protein